ncbi:hypothetical protein [Oryzomonas rubra]|uniref:Uncharacterized protein n=1 Tax=Oryzomonas rubra TaxID=2509454 RepID=A0A5A9X7J4_9BACT|nr:hypothetical protein [Oryzomonas rubra]KAA0888764.1 hypothetical protein ET418_15400 [Oryzomonas rubra]
MGNRAGTSANSDTTDTSTTEEVQEFPVTLTEFLAEIQHSQAERKASFEHLCKKEGINGRKTRAEWNALITSFDNKPVGTTWTDWQNQGGK